MSRGRIAKFSTDAEENLCSVLFIYLVSYDPTMHWDDVCYVVMVNAFNILLVKHSVSAKNLGTILQMLFRIRSYVYWDKITHFREISTLFPSFINSFSQSSNSDSTRNLANPNRKSNFGWRLDEVNHVPTIDTWALDSHCGTQNNLINPITVQCSNQIHEADNFKLMHRAPWIRLCSSDPWSHMAKETKRQTYGTWK